MNKKELFKIGLEIECIHHGIHKNWRKSGNFTKCKICEKERNLIYRNNDPIRFMLNDAKQHAKQKNIIFDLKKDDILNLLIHQDNKCAISGISFDLEKFSIDKIDPQKGYTNDNIQLLTINVNRMKSDFDQNYFLSVCKKIYETQSK